MNDSIEALSTSSTYRRLFAELGEFDPRLEVNGFNSTILNDYPFILDSWVDAEMAMLTIAART